ncbi:MAG: hypothetical protein WCA08_26340, partial [Desulfoferrobacter sp.]
LLSSRRVFVAAQVFEKTEGIINGLTRFKFARSNQIFVPIKDENLLLFSRFFSYETNEVSQEKFPIIQ